MKLTFAELRDLSAKLAGFLKSIGIGRGDKVAVMLPTSGKIQRFLLKNEG